MYRGAICSAFLHLAVFLFAVIGLPHFVHELPMMDYPVPVDVVTIADITNAPPPEAEKKEEPKPEPPKPEEAKPPPPPPEPEAAKPEPPKPEEPKPEPPKAIAEVAPPPTPKPKTKPEPPVKEVKPEKKPPPPDEMASILKTVEKLKEKQPPVKKEEKVESEESFLDTAEKLKNRAPRDYDSSAPITISQIDAIRRHFEKCWNIPAGAREAEDLAVQIRVTMAPDATVQQATIVPDSRLMTDGFYRAAAESALRAVLHPRCHSLQDIGLRPEQYDQWRDMIITFNPKQMIGA